MAKMVKTNTPGIYKRGKRYVITWEHRGKQHKEAFRTMAEAREAKAARQSGDRRPTSRIGFEDYFERWIESYSGRTARGFTDSSRDSYRYPIESHALPVWRSWRLAEIEPVDVRDLFGKMRRDGKGTAAIKKLRAPLSALFATAVEEGLLRSNPVQGVRIPNGSDAEPEDDRRVKALTREELRLLLAALPERWRLFHEFLAHTGLRISEAVGLRWEHVELGDRPHVKVREQFYRAKRRKLKSDSGRRDVPLSAGMVEKLLAHRRDSYGGPEAPLFASATGTPLIGANIAKRVLRPTAEAVGLGRVTFHSLRHSCASMLFEQGRNIKQVQAWLGHADPALTLRTYVHLMDEGVGDADFMDAATAPGGQGGKGVASQALQTTANRNGAESPEMAH
jgi:integrase